MQQQNLTFDNTAAEITRLHSEVIEGLKTGFTKAQRIGELLAEQKARLPHGQFGQWIAGNLPFSERTARRYMRLHIERDRLKTDSVSDLAGAYRLLEDDSRAGRLEEQERLITSAMGDAADLMDDLIPPPGHSYEWTLGGESVHVDPTDDDDYRYVTFVDAESVVVAMKRAVIATPAVIKLVVNAMKATHVVRDGERNVWETDFCGRYNPWLYDSYEEYRQREREMWDSAVGLQTSES